MSERDVAKKACKGAQPEPASIGGSPGLRCADCGLVVRDYMKDHHFFGFAAGCPFKESDDE